LDRDLEPFVVERVQRALDHRHGLVELAQQHFHGRVGWIGELLLALTLVTAAGNDCPDVVVQVTGQVQNQVADAVAEGEGLGPERPGGHRVNEVVDPMGQVFEVAGTHLRSAGRGRTWSLAQSWLVSFRRSERVSWIDRHRGASAVAAVCSLGRDRASRESLYSKASMSASQLASMTFSETPTVPQTESWSRLSITTRTRAAVPARALMTRTL